MGRGQLGQFVQGPDFGGGGGGGEQNAIREHNITLFHYLLPWAPKRFWAAMAQIV